MIRAAIEFIILALVGTMACMYMAGFAGLV